MALAPPIQGMIRMSNKMETQNLESIDLILQNLKIDSNFYSHGTEFETYMQEEQRD